MQPPLACGRLHSTKKIWEVINLTFIHFIIIQTTPSEMQQLKDNMDNFFLVMMGCIILFMQVCFLYFVFFDIF